MLFEIHDILLHRLWKTFKNPLTEKWYFHHQRKFGGPYMLPTPKMVVINKVKAEHVRCG